MVIREEETLLECNSLHLPDVSCALEMWIFLLYWLYRECWEPALKQSESCLAKTRAPGTTSHWVGVTQEQVPTAVCVGLPSRASFLWNHCNEDLFLIRPGFESATSYNTALSHLFWLKAVSSEWHLQRWRGDQHCPLHTAGPPFRATSTGSRGCQAQQRWPRHSPWAQGLLFLMSNKVLPLKPGLTYFLLQLTTSFPHGVSQQSNWKSCWHNC